MSFSETMLVVESLGRIADGLEAIRKELNYRRNLDYPIIAPRWPMTKVTHQKEKELTEMGTFITFETTLHPLPPKEGRNADITKGEFVVIADGVQVSQTDVQYDLTSREPVAPVAWRAPKGSRVLLRLAYLDDDGNRSPYTDSEYGVVTDTIAPDAPTEVGATKVIAEVVE